ncbi:hypothetical protein BgiBS90_035154 [Biomphalaria glabrata]|nr:hypothetical protein BgiBS90_035154 [Biomphalaria glabrata]
MELPSLYAVVPFQASQKCRLNIPKPRNWEAEEDDVNSISSAVSIQRDNGQEMSSCDETASQVSDDTASQVSDDTASQVSDDTASQVSDDTASEISVVPYEESPPLTLTTANIKIQSIFRQSSRDSILSQAASAVSVQHVITSYTSQKQRPLPLLPGESHTREICLNIFASEIKTSQESDAPTALRQYQGVQSPRNVLSERKASKRKKVSGNSCLFPKKYYKVSDPFEQRKNMSWLLRKKTLVCFSSLSVALSFVSCGLLLVMKFWTHSTPQELNVCAETNSRNQSRATNTSRSSSNCYSEQLDQVRLFKPKTLNSFKTLDSAQRSLCGSN